MRHFTSIVVVMLASLVCVGCADLQFHPLRNLRDAVHGEPRINDNVFMLHNGGEADDYADVPVVIPLACLPPDSGPKKLDDTDTRAAPGAAERREQERNLAIEDGMTTMKGSAIRNCTYAMKLLIDTRWAHFEHVLNASLSTSNFILDAAVTGLTTAIPLVGSVTKDILGAIAGGISGTRKNFNEDILYSYSIQSILQQMRTDRAEVATRIEAHLARNRSYSTMYEASIDLFEYDQAGSWDHAMSSLQTNIAATTAACQARLRNQQMASATGGDEKGSKTVAPIPSTPTEPCGPAPTHTGTPTETHRVTSATDGKGQTRAQATTRTRSPGVRRK